jgi:polysaccharide chain length determinant protein (PEP-CTERM system associated)
MIDEHEEQSSYQLDRLWAMARRGRWWILLPMFLCWFLVWLVSWLLPTTYESEALVLIEQQKVPEQYVLSNVSVNVQERLQSMTQQILSRTRLQEIIDTYHLYPAQGGLRQLFSPGDPVEQMRKHIKIELVQPPGKPAELTAFKINYSAGSAELAQQVNNKLTGRFIDESLNSQRELSQSTTNFLKNQLDQAAKDLQEQEKLLRDFKAKHLGDLPSQLQSNVEILSGLQAQQQNIQHGLDTAKQQKLYLESQLHQLQVVQSALGGVGAPSELESLEKQLSELRNDLADERGRHTDDHPNIVELRRRIEETEKSISNLQNTAAAEQSQSSKATPTDSLAVIPTSPLMQIRSQLKANELEIQNYQRQERIVEEKISDYRSRLNLTPATEQELAEISRGYEESRANYNSLLQKQNQSQLATNLEQRQGGEQFRVLDPPSFPDKPKSPNHLLLSLGGLAIGALLGVGLLALQEVTNARVRHEDDIDGIVAARILVRIPHLDMPREARLRSASYLLEAVAVALMTILVLAGNLYSFYKG